MLYSLKQTPPLLFFVNVCISKRYLNSLSSTHICNRISQRYLHSTGALNNLHPWLVLKMQWWESPVRYMSMLESIPSQVVRLYKTRRMGHSVTVAILVVFVVAITIAAYGKARKEKKERRKGDSFWKRWKSLLKKGGPNAPSQLPSSTVLNSERSRTLFERDLELEIQRCKCKANGKNRAMTYRPGYLLQATQLFSLSSEVVVDIFIQQVIKVIRSYVITAFHYTRSNLVEQCLQELSNLLKLHRQWIKPALMDWTQGDDIAFQTLFAKLNIFIVFIWNSNRQALQTYLGINKEEALVAEEYVAGCVYKMAAVQVFETGVIQLEKLDYLIELQKFLAVVLKKETTLHIYMETAKPFVVKYLWDIIRDQGITLQQAISKLSYLESTLNIELEPFFTNLQGHESDMELQRKKHTLWKFWTSYKQGLRSQKNSFKATPWEDSEKL
ncbi:hypothetical protein Gasu2_43570 [Galdieria sulphuraria]|nr:hypothetical protein Gasu2_43570 [Galdieria sulphuraria]